MKNNADVGSKIAVELTKLNAPSNTSSSSPLFHIPTVNIIKEKGSPVTKSPVSMSSGADFQVLGCLPVTGILYTYLRFHLPRLGIAWYVQVVSATSPVKYYILHVSINTCHVFITTLLSLPVLQAVVGGAVFDFTAKVKTKHILCEGTNRGVLQTSLGGVGRNLAEVLARLGMQPCFITAVGRDDPGQRILQHMRELGMVSQGRDNQ